MQLIRIPGHVCHLNWVKVSVEQCHVELNSIKFNYKADWKIYVQPNKIIAFLISATYREDNPTTTVPPFDFFNHIFGGK